MKEDLKPSYADVHLIVVTSPFKGYCELDISFVQSATQELQEMIYSKRSELRDKIHKTSCLERVMWNANYEQYYIVDSKLKNKSF